LEKKGMKHNERYLCGTRYLITWKVRTRSW